MTAVPRKVYSIEEYLELERNSEEKLEFWDGHVWSMSGARFVHNLISSNFNRALGNKLVGRPCTVLQSDMRVKVPDYPPYRYPDATALCEEPEIETIGGIEMLVNPQLIVEILSDSTEAFDRGDKFTYYKSIPSFSEYLLIAQHRPHVTQFVKHGDGFWANFEYNDLKDVIELRSVACTLALIDIYRDVTFPDPGPLSPGQNSHLS